MKTSNARKAKASEKPKAPKKAKLTPPDPKRCQAESRSFMTLGPGRVRCSNTPTVIITEKKPGPDGQRGSMSLCAECLPVFKKEHPEISITETPVSKE